MQPDAAHVLCSATVFSSGGAAIRNPIGRATSNDRMGDEPAVSTEFGMGNRFAVRDRTRRDPPMVGYKIVGGTMLDCSIFRATRFPTVSEASRDVQGD